MGIPSRFGGMCMSDVMIEIFIEKLTRFYGRAFDIVSGCDAYSFEKVSHKNMINHEGVYLLLENVPLDNMIRKYDKATLIPATTVDNMFPTNNPEAVKKGYSLSGSKLRVEFYKQCVKLFQAPPVLIREVVFTTPRKTFRMDRKDWVWLRRYNGEVIFICTIPCGSVRRLADIIRIPSKDIVFDEGQNSKNIVLDLDGIVLKRIEDLGYTVTAKYGVLTNGQYYEKINGILQEEKSEQSWNAKHGIDQSEPIHEVIAAVEKAAAYAYNKVLQEQGNKKPEVNNTTQIKIGDNLTLKINDVEVECVITNYRKV
jgi:hypothetical protein